MQKLGPILMLSALMVCGGCAGLSRTNWACPGSAKLQQVRAEWYDPYPETPSGGSTMAGVRPREYEKPVPEVLQVRRQSCR